LGSAWRSTSPSEVVFALRLRLKGSDDLGVLGDVGNGIFEYRASCGVFANANVAAEEVGLGGDGGTAGDAIRTVLERCEDGIEESVGH
jgi:hypothetical protein